MGGIVGAGTAGASAGVAGGMAATTTPPLATVARPDTGQKSIADQAEKRGARGAGGAPSGSITHPGLEDSVQETLSKDADGNWNLRDDESGETWRWDPDARLWRGVDGGAGDVLWPAPERLARDLSLDIDRKPR